MVGKEKVNVLMIYPTREYKLLKTSVKIDNMIEIPGALFKIDPRAVFVNREGERLVILYRMNPVAFNPDVSDCPKEVGECFINPTKLGEYINETFNPDIQWLIKERWVREVYLKPTMALVIVLAVAMLVIGFLIGLMF